MLALPVNSGTAGGYKTLQIAPAASTAASGRNGIKARPRPSSSAYPAGLRLLLLPPCPATPSTGYARTIGVEHTVPDILATVRVGAVAVKRGPVSMCAVVIAASECCGGRSQCNYCQRQQGDDCFSNHVSTRLFYRQLGLSFAE